MSKQTRDWRNQATVDAAMLRSDLDRVGLTSGRAVLVHSSLSQVGHVQGGATAVIDALLDIVSPGGTVLFPALTGKETDGPQHAPTMDVRSTPCWTGQIPETARLRHAAWRSVHPTHSVVALGAAAEHSVAGHQHSVTPCDQYSPYFRLIEEDGLILLLGVNRRDQYDTPLC